MVNNTLEQYDEEKIRNHWRRTKKASIDLQELPVAVDRQLEDQRLLMELNKNPQLLVPTKVDRVRSEQIIAKVGMSRAVSIKAKVLNKIVREASGVNGYVITAPPRSGEDKPEPELDADTNPHFKAYARETKNNPVIVSFGHRPRSASRTFNPATMRFRMRHGEMVKAPGAGKYGFGLPVGILSKILKAPKIEPFGASQGMVDSDDDNGTLPSLAASADPHDLFSLPNEPESPTYNNNNSSGSNPLDDSLGMESWISPTQQSLELKQARAGGRLAAAALCSKGGGGGGGGGKKPNKLAIDTAGSSGLDERPQWDEAHHSVKHSPKEIYKIKANIMPNQPYTILERMQRFNSKTIADEITPFCQEKQALDMLVLRTGKAPKIVISPTKGQPKFFDPNNTNLDYVKKGREEQARRHDRKWKRRDFQEALMAIPKVAYHPETLSLQMQAGQVKLADIPPLVRQPTDWETFKPPPVVVPRAGAETKVASPPLSSASAPGILSQSESDLIAAMKRAKHGNRRALFNLFLGEGDRAGTSVDSEALQIEQWVHEAERGSKEGALMVADAAAEVPLELEAEEVKETAEPEAEAEMDAEQEVKAKLEAGVNAASPVVDDADTSGASPGPPLPLEVDAQEAVTEVALLDAAV